MSAVLDLGPATEARITEAFKKRLLLAAQDLTGLLGVNEKTLRLMREAGLIGCVQVGAGTFRYREQDVRAFLSSETPQAALKEEPPCPSTSQQSRRISTSTSGGTVIDFTGPRSKKRNGRLRK